MLFQGGPVSNEAIADARGFPLERLECLDVELFEPEPEKDAPAREPGGGFVALR